MGNAADELGLTCAELKPALDLLQSLGLRLDIIYPADEPHTAILSRDGKTVRLTSRAGAPPPVAELPEFRPEFVVSFANISACKGRAGMAYRDLIPSRLGGRYIASSISIAAGGPVADWVHFHRLAFQIICVRKGWVRVVYEDQGEPFVMEAGDLVLQPPGIRHRVLESSAGLEVVEISCPALHETIADHAITLPNERIDRARMFRGQHFLRHVASETPWVAYLGAEAKETGLRDATFGLADARFIRRGGSPIVAFPPHDGELAFGFVLEGNVTLDHGEGYQLGPADAFVIPPGEGWSLCDLSDNLQLLHVTTGNFGPSE